MEENKKVLLYDLEISPTLGWTYNRFDARVIKVEEEPYILCFSYCWLGGKIKNVSLPAFDLYKKDPHNDRDVVKKLWELLDQAEVVIAHNANGFDNKVSNERFLEHGLGPVSPYKSVDTLSVARSKFKFWSNSLDNICRKLELGQKTDEKHGALWYNCIQGDKKAWKKMVIYCNQDVRLLRELYLRILPFITNHPNMANILEKVDVCPKCGSTKLQYRGVEHTKTQTYHRVQCMNCLGWSRERLVDKEFDGEKVVPVHPAPTYV